MPNHTASPIIALLWPGGNWQARHAVRRIANLAGCVALFLSLIGCGSLPGRAPSSDSTPPTVRWSILNQDTRDVTRISGSGQVAFHTGTPLMVVFFAEDPEGVKRITLSGDGQIVCNAGDAQSIGLLGGTNQDVTLPTGTVTTSAFLIDYRNQNPNANECSGGGMSFARETFQYNGSGENFGNLTTSGTLTIEFQP